MRTLFIFILPLLLFSEDWESKFNEVCKRDILCYRLKGSDGTWFKPKPEIIVLLKDPAIQDAIKQASSKYGVDSTAVAGAIVAENSLNVGVADSVQNWLAKKMGITKIGNKSFSFGLGQISLPAAQDAENYLAQLEKRPVKSEAELTKEITDPMGSIRIAATIVRKVQDDYKKQGYDISKDPGILSSLYNLGQSEKRAKQAKREGRLPQINYFGLFVQKYSNEIQTAAKLSPRAESAIGPLVASKSPVQVDPKSESSGADVVLKKVVESKNLVKANIVTNSVPLTSAPLQCDSSSYGQNFTGEINSIGFGAPIAVLDKGESYTEVSRTFDCRTNVWKLVRGSGKVGWIKEEQLEKVQSFRFEKKRICTRSKSEASCKISVEKSSDEFSAGSKKSDGLIYLKPVSNNTDGKISFKNEDFDCGNQPPEARSSYFKPGFERPKISPKELRSNSEALKKIATQELARMSKELKIPIDQLEEPENPYSVIAKGIAEANNMAKACLEALSSEMVACSVSEDNLTEYKEKIEKIQYNLNPNLSEVLRLGQYLKHLFYRGGSFYFNSYLPGEDEISTATSGEIKESISDCHDRVNNLRKSLSSQQKNLQGGAVPQNGSGGSPNPSLSLGQGMMGGFGYPIYGDDSIDKFEQVVSASQKATDEQIKKYSSEFIGFAKFCHARMNLLQPNNKMQNRFNCTQAPKYLTNNFQLFSRELVVKLYQQNPAQLLSEIQQTGNSFVRQSTVDDVLGVQNSTQKSRFYKSESYCPNRTAEYIEELVRNNPCIQRVYVPTRYLSKKLSNLDSKVIYREFEEDGMYAVETGDASCD